MIIKVAIEHAEVDALMKATELNAGHVEKFRIELRDDIPHRGFAPYPLGAVEAYRLNDNGGEVFMFYNKDDDYYRGTIMTRDCLANEPVFIEAITPYADKERELAEAAAKREATIQLSRQRDEERRREEERQKGLEDAVFSKLYAYLGQNKPPFPDYNDRFTAKKLLELEALQGGTLDLNVLKFDMAHVGNLSTQTINREIMHAMYCEKYKHDVHIEFPNDDQMVIAFKDLKGNILSQGTFGLYESEGHSVHRDGDYEENVTYNTQYIDIEDDVVAPKIIEKGRPVLLKDSRFKEAYHVMQEIEIVDASDLDYVEGTAADRSETKRMEMFARTLLQSGRVSHKILNELLPKGKSFENTSLGLG